MVRVRPFFWRQLDRGALRGVPSCYRLVWYLPDWRQVSDDLVEEDGRRVASVLSDDGSVWTCAPVSLLDRVLDWSLVFRRVWSVHRLFLWDPGGGAESLAWVWIRRGGRESVSFYQDGRFYDPSSFHGMFWTDGFVSGRYPVPLLVRVVAMSTSEGDPVLDVYADPRVSGVSLAMGRSVVSLVGSRLESPLLSVEVATLRETVRSHAIRVRLDPSDMDEPSFYPTDRLLRARPKVARA